jgi:hypothetical protein
MDFIIDPSMKEAYETWCNSEPTDYERAIMSRYKDDIFMSFNAGWVAAKEFIRNTNSSIQQQVQLDSDSIARECIKAIEARFSLAPRELT